MESTLLSIRLCRRTGVGTDEDGLCLDHGISDCTTIFHNSERILQEDVVVA